MSRPRSGSVQLSNKANQFQIRPRIIHRQNLRNQSSYLRHRPIQKQLDQSVPINPQIKDQLSQISKCEFILVQEPQEKQYTIPPLDLKDASRLILEIINRIHVLQRKKIFYPDLLIINHNNGQTTCEQKIMKDIERKRIPKKTHQLVLTSERQINCTQIIKSFKSKHENIMKMYKINEKHQIFQQFIEELQLTKQSLNNLQGLQLKPLIHQIEAILEKLCRNQNRRYLLYAIYHISRLLLQTPQQISNPGFFINYYMTLLLQKDSRCLQQIEQMISILFEKNPQGSHLFDQKTHIMFSHSIKRVSETKDHLVEAGASSIYKQQSSMEIGSSSLKIRKIDPDPDDNNSSPRKKFKGSLSVEKKMLLPQDIDYNQDQNIKANIALHIINFLSKQSTNYIAKYQIVQLKFNKNGFVTSYEYYMERGDDDFIENNQKYVGVSNLINQGKNGIINFFVSSSLGIAEMEELGIYHSDLSIKNNIKFHNVYQSIDYNNALACKFDKMTREQSEPLKRLAKLAIQRWLTNRNTMFTILFEKNQFFKQIKQKYRNNHIQLEQAKNECFQCLPFLMQVGHKNKFKEIVDSILCSVSELLDPSQIKFIQDLLKRFITRENPNYVCFAAELNAKFKHQEKKLDLSEKILLCGKTVETVSNYLDRTSLCYEQRNIFLLKSIQLYKLLSEKKLTFISKPFFHGNFIIKDESDQQIDYQIVYRDDSKNIKCYEDIWFEGEDFIYQAIYKIMKIVEEMNSLKIFHKNLNIQCFVKKSNTLYLRYMQGAQLLQNQQSSQAQHEFKVQYYKKLAKKIAWMKFAEMMLNNKQKLMKIQTIQDFPLPFVLPEVKGKSLQQQMRVSHIKQAKVILNKIISIPGYYVNKSDQNYQKFIREEKQPIEAKIKEITLQDGFDQLKAYIKSLKDLRQLKSSLKGKHGKK